MVGHYSAFARAISPAEGAAGALLHLEFLGHRHPVGMAVGGAEANVVTRKQMTLAPQFGRHVEFETRRVVADADADVGTIRESLIALHEHPKCAYAGSERLEVVSSVIGRY